MNYIEEGIRKFKCENVDVTHLTMIYHESFAKHFSTTLDSKKINAIHENVRVQLKNSQELDQICPDLISYLLKGLNYMAK